jgi:hypothetical protein
MKITRVHRESTRTLNLLFSKPKRSFPTRFLWPRYLPSLIFPWKERELRGKEKICLTAWGFRNFWIGYAQMGRQIRKTKTKASPEKSKADKKISRNPLFYFKSPVKYKIADVNLLSTHRAPHIFEHFSIVYFFYIWSRCRTPVHITCVYVCAVYTGRPCINSPLRISLRYKNVLAGKTKS